MVPLTGESRTEPISYPPIGYEYRWYEYRIPKVLILDEIAMSVRGSNLFKISSACLVVVVFVVSMFFFLSNKVYVAPCPCQLYAKVLETVF